MSLTSIMGLLKEYIILGIFAMAFCGILFFIGYKLIYQKVMKGTKVINKKSLILYGISICYAVIVIGAVFLSRSSGIYGKNLYLFSSYKDAYNKMQISLFRNIVLNILLFVPLGILLPIYSYKLKKIYKVALIGFFITLGIETFQYFMKLGIFEIDDIFNNTLGTLIGYSIFMIFYNLNIKKNKRYIICYTLPIIITFMVFIGIYFKYQSQEFGNLIFDYNYKINMKNVKVESNVEFSKERSNQNIYYKKILDNEETRKIAEYIFSKNNISIDEDETDIYDETAIYYSTNRKYSIWIDYNGGTYEYTDFSMFPTGKENGISKKNDASRQEIVSALKKLGIDSLDSAKFNKLSNSIYDYEFVVNMKKDGDSLINGKLLCSYYEDNTVKKIANNIIKYDKIKEKEIISEEEAYNEILNGKFRYDEYFIDKIRNIEINSVELRYDLDTKGYYVPIYVFKTKINDETATIQIPALN